MAIFFVAENSTAPKLQCQYVGRDLTGFTVQLRIERPDDTVVVVNGTVTDGPSGAFEIPAAADWPANLWQRGKSWAPIYLTSSGGQVESVRDLYFDVAKGI